MLGNDSFIGAFVNLSNHLFKALFMLQTIGLMQVKKRNDSYRFAAKHR